MMKSTFAILLALLSVAVSTAKADESTLSARAEADENFGNQFCYCSQWNDSSRSGENWVQGFKTDNCKPRDPKASQWWCQPSDGLPKAVDGSERDLCKCDRDRMDRVYGGACSNGGKSWCTNGGLYNYAQGWYCRQKPGGK